jgi:magnesium chelatase family protein
MSMTTATASVLVPVLRGIRATLATVVATRVPSGEGGVYDSTGKVAREPTIRVRAALAATLGIASPGDIGWSVRVDLPSGAGASADLGAAVAALAVLGHCSVLGEPTVFVGEVGFSGGLRPTRDVYAAAKAAGDVTTMRVIVPATSGPAAAAGAHANAPAMPEVLLAADLGEVLAFLKNEDERPLPRAMFVAGTERGQDLGPLPPENEAILATVRAHLAAGRSVLLRGNVGAGKVMIARRVTHYGPPLAVADVEIVTAIQHAAGLATPDTGTIRRPPFRAPHHTVSEAGLFGSGVPVRPGEVSLAHAGVLFLDEVAEFRRSCLEAVRLARRDGCVRYCRHGEDVTLPARFGLIGATNLCPCGYHGTDRCHCDVERIVRYRDRIPAGLFDVEIDLPELGATRRESQASAAV